MDGGLIVGSLIIIAQLGVIVALVNRLLLIGGQRPIAPISMAEEAVARRMNRRVAKEEKPRAPSGRKKVSL